MWQYQSVQLVSGVAEAEETDTGAEKFFEEISVKLPNLVKDKQIHKTQQNISRMKKNACNQTAEI